MVFGSGCDSSLGIEGESANTFFKKSQDLLGVRNNSFTDNLKMFLVLTQRVKFPLFNQTKER